MSPEAIKIPSALSVRDFAAKLGIPVTTVTAELIRNGIMKSLNEEIDFDTAQIIAEDLGKNVALDEQVADESGTMSVNDYLKDDTANATIERPPVVVVMGHVDHGKTSLLDAIRKTSVTEDEAGGITQHIGAYQVTEQDRLITFVDTPGHEAFTQMRARGAKIADVAILVVAADDGVKPQTKEALQIIHQTGIPYLIAITKTDKDEAQPDRVKKELAENQVQIEEFGGKTPVVAVSAKTQAGIHELLESIILLSDINREALLVNPDRSAIGTIIESHVDPKQGPVASVLVQSGTLHVGDEVIVGQVYGKIRSLKTDRGTSTKSAPPSMPVQILGLKAAPQVGDVLRVSAADVKELKKKSKSRQMSHHLQSVVGQRAVATKKKTTDDGQEETPEIKKHLIILKTDTVGSAEAIIESLKKIQHPEVSVEIMQRGLGIVTESDVLRAEGAKATIYAFHVPISPKADHLARSKNLTIKPFTVIYDLLDDIKQALNTLLPPVTVQTEIGRLQVLAIFRNENTFQVVGGKVTSGEIRLQSNVQILRKGQPVSTGRITQLQQNKQNAQTVSQGNECGMKIEGDPVIQVGDEVVASVSQTHERTIDDPVSE